MMLVAFFNAVNFAKLIEGALATAGGFLVGYVLVWIFGWWADKYLFKRPSPMFAHRVCRMLGGLILAILVAMMVFGGGGGDGDGTGEGSGNGKASPTNGSLDATTPNTTPQPLPTKPLPPTVERVRITMLGGSDVKDQKFYLVDDDAMPRAFAEVKAAVQKKKESTAKPLGLEIRFTPQNTLPQDHRAVTQLARWAKDTAGMDVTFPAEAP